MKRQTAKFRLNGRHETIKWQIQDIVNLKETREGDRVNDKNLHAEWENLQETLISKGKHYTAPVLLQKTAADNFALLQEQIRVGAVSRQVCMSEDTLHFTTSFLTSLLHPQLGLCNLT